MVCTRTHANISNITKNNKSRQHLHGTCVYSFVHECVYPIFDNTGDEWEVGNVLHVRSPPRCTWEWYVTWVFGRWTQD